jgi:NAD-dependent DNA ligase
MPCPIHALAGALTTIKGVNKVDVVTLGSTFGTLAALMTATTDQLAACPGLGPTKVRRIHDTFHAPFRRTARQLRIQDAVRDGSAGGGGAGAAAAGTEAQQQGGIGGAAVGAHDGGQLPPRQEAPAASFAPAPLQQQLQQQQQQALPPATGADVRAAEDDAAAAYGEDDDGYAAAGAAEFDEDFEVEADAHLYACADPEMSDEDPAGRL